MSGARPLKLLVVEAEPVARKALAELLADEGFQVETATDGRDAASKARSFGPDVVVAEVAPHGAPSEQQLVEGLRHPGGTPAIVGMGVHPVPPRNVGPLRAYVEKPLHLPTLLALLRSLPERVAAPSPVPAR